MLFNGNLRFDTVKEARHRALLPLPGDLPRDKNGAFANICWCIIMFGGPNGSLTVKDCNLANYDHGIGGAASSTGVISTNNHFGSTANWDTTANTYHPDGIHTF